MKIKDVIKYLETLNPECMIVACGAFVDDDFLDKRTSDDYYVNDEHQNEKVFIWEG